MEETLEPQAMPEREARRGHVAATTRPVLAPLADLRYEVYSQLTERLTVAINHAEHGCILLVCSAEPGEGKTTTVVNVAQARCLLAPRQQVLVVDAALRNPSVHDVWNEGRSPGLSEALMGDVEFDAACRAVEPAPIWILSAGSDPISFAAHLQEWENLMSQMRSRFRFTLIDTSAAERDAAAEVLGPRCDGVLLVVRADTTPRGKVLATTQKLRSAGANLIGTVLHDASPHLPQRLQRMLRV